jgi:hypothetical protein
MPYEHMLDQTLPLSARTADMVGAGAPNAFAQSLVNPALPLTGAWEVDRATAAHNAALEEMELLDDDELGVEGEYELYGLDEDDDLDDLGFDEDDDFGIDEEDDDLDDLGFDEDDDFGIYDEDDDFGIDDEDDDFGIDDDDDEEYGIGPRRRARLLGKRRRLTARWVQSKGKPRRRARLRRKIARVSLKLGMPMPKPLRKAKARRVTRAAPARGPVRVMKPGVVRKPAPMPGAPAFVAPGVVRPAPVRPVPVRPAPVAPIARRRRGRKARQAAAKELFRRRTTEIAPGVRRGPGGAIYQKQGPGKWIRKGPKGGVQQLQRGPGGRWQATRVRGQFGAEAQPVTGIGSAMLAFPFQSLFVVGGAAVAGAVAAPFIQDAWERLGWGMPGR